MPVGPGFPDSKELLTYLEKENVVKITEDVMSQAPVLTVWFLNNHEIQRCPGVNVPMIVKVNDCYA